MWRWISLAVAVVVLSGAATVAVQMIPSNDPQIGLLPAPEVQAGPLPLVVIETGGDPFHAFGNMAQEDIGTHEWVIKNAGEGDLKLSQGEKTCSCTIASLKEGETAVVKPGEKTNIKLRWETRMNDGHFEKSSAINTNDPEHPKIKFVASGTVQPAIVRVPGGEVLDLGNVPNEKDYTSKVVLYSPDKQDFKITKVRTRDSGFLGVVPRPLTPEELKGAPVTQGYALMLTVKPGSHLGSFREEVAVETDHRLKPEVKFPVLGKVVGPVSASPESIQLHHVSSSRGGQGVLMLSVRDREDSTRFEIASQPKGLKVSIHESDAKKGMMPAGTRQYLLTVAVPPGMPPGEILGVIELKADHPKASLVKIPVDILVLTSE